MWRDDIMENEKLIVKTKLNIEYLLFERLLEIISHLGIIRIDRKLSEKFRELAAYIDSKLILPDTMGDIADMYVVVEQNLKKS